MSMISITVNDFIFEGSTFRCLAKKQFSGGFNLVDCLILQTCGKPEISLSLLKQQWINADLIQGNYL